MTTLTTTLVLVHIAFKGRRPTWTFNYGIYWLFYQLATLLVLRQTQHFYHDELEATTGLNAAMKWSAPVLIIYCIVEYYNRLWFAA